MAELVASVDRRLTGTYLWEEVLEPLGTVRRHVLAVLCDLGGADEDLASAAVGTRVDLVEVLEGVPLIARGSDGWFVPHALWRSAPGIAVPDTERGEVRRRAVEHLVERGRFEEAFALLQEIGLWDAAPAVLRAASMANDRIFSGQLGRWLALCPEAVRESSAGLLAAGVDASNATPARALAPLRKAVEQFRSEGDADAELTATAHIGRLAWWWQDTDLLQEIAPRVFDLAAEGIPKAKALAGFGWALAGDIMGHEREALGFLGEIDTAVLEPVWEVLAKWNEGAIRLYMGDADAAEEIVEGLSKTSDPALAYLVEFLGQLVSWAKGNVDEVVAALERRVASVRATGVPYNVYQGMCFISFAYSLTGDVAGAQQCVDEAIDAVDPTEGPLPVLTTLAVASLRLAEGKEGEATGLLQGAMGHYGVNQSVDRRWWRQMLSLSYVLLPDARVVWDDVVLRGHLATARELSGWVVALREGSVAPLRSASLPDIGMIRASLHYRFAAELAVGLAAAGRAEGRTLLDALGPPGRTAVRDLVTTQPKLARQAKALLAAVPAPPPETTYLAVLGPLVLRRGGPDGSEIANGDLRRLRVQELLAYLVGHRRTNRAAITAALWPDLDERSANNNLGVTINHLLRVLEPWRGSGEPAFLLRLDGHAVQLVAGNHLRIDVDEFDDHLTAAAGAEADGTPSLALDHLLAAVGLYRDHLHVDLPEADWFALEREHYRTRFVAAAIRAGQLLLGRGDPDRAQVVAHKALAVDQWSEEAYGVLVGSALARGDRSGARRLLDRCLAALDDLGAEPAEATQQLRRRVLGIASNRPG
jgi:DNA-binding SARP family transcriptional activator